MLASPRMMPPPIGHALHRVQYSDRGEIDNIDITGWDAAAFFDHLRSCGYRSRDCRKYQPLSLTFVDGACRWHTDPGFGIVACWLVHSENPLGIDAQLITKRGPVDMRVGDLCVFDADQGHAWMSNGVCVMVMATISRWSGWVA